LDTLSKIIQYETEGLNDTEMLNLFAELIKSGMAWTLQGSYGRTARALIDSGYISSTGKILKCPEA
jgi:hypothetical protein